MGSPRSPPSWPSPPSPRSPPSPPAALSFQVGPYVEVKVHKPYAQRSTQLSRGNVGYGSQYQASQTVPRTYYAVLVGWQPGIYTSWEECWSRVEGFRGAKYASFSTEEEARRYLGWA